MRYNELRDTLVRALRDSRFRFIGCPTETLDLTTTTRRCEIFLEGVTVQRAEPFYVAASVAFDWDPFESARTYTNEDDLISELLGRDEETVDTMPRRLRVDFVLKASLSYEIQVPLLGVDRWRSWAHATHESLHTLLPTEAPAHRGGPIMVTGWGGTVAVESECSATGEILLRVVSLPSWQTVVLPRLRGSLDEEPEVDVVRQLDVLIGRYRTAVDTWTDRIAELSEEVQPYLREP